MELDSITLEEAQELIDTDIDQKTELFLKMKFGDDLYEDNLIYVPALVAALMSRSFFKSVARTIFDEVKEEIQKEADRKTHVFEKHHTHLIHQDTKRRFGRKK